MKIFPTSLIAEIDRYTIQHEPISDIDLMERASDAIFNYIVHRTTFRGEVMVFCGPGNNGGDGLAIARMLSGIPGRFSVAVYLFDFGRNLSDSTKINLDRLLELGIVTVEFPGKIESFPSIPDGILVIDALFGSGLNRPLEGLAASIIKHINCSKASVLSIDIPSGLMGEDNRKNNPKNIVLANKTLTFQFPKLSFLFAENEIFVGEWEVLDIGLHPEAIQETPSSYHFLDRNEMANKIHSRKKFSHKGNFGHALLISGSYGKMGAAVLASKACLRSGTGLLTVHVPHGTYHVVQTALPEAMCSIDDSDLTFTGIGNLDLYSAIGIGPAIGQKVNTQEGLYKLLGEINIPLVVDADAINILGLNPDYLKELPEGTILTPHPREFSRIAGGSENSYDRIEKALSLTRNLKIFIVLKGAHTAIVCPDGEIWFNSTGNPGMATAGSGDVLTGVILGLLAQGYSSKDAALTGVYVHGLAGDLAKDKTGEISLIASDIIDFLGDAFKLICK
jgi:ADP-dependent NAD(P)H-hydrate dehydratase / NAD(P)H-hydrate epimerase